MRSGETTHLVTNPIAGSPVRVAMNSVDLGGETFTVEDVATMVVMVGTGRVGGVLDAGVSETAAHVEIVAAKCRLACARLMQELAAS